MIRPYLYANWMFRSRSKDRVRVEADRAFFRGFLGAMKSPKVASFLRHPLVSRDLKFQALERALRSISSCDQSHEDLLKRWIEKDYFPCIQAVFVQWSILVEDFFQEGEIVISSSIPLAPPVLASLEPVFRQKEPNRKFTFRYAENLTGGPTAQFRDCVLDLRANVLLKKIILSLKEGF